MLKKFTSVLPLLIALSIQIRAQTTIIDSLKSELKNAQSDTARLRIYIALGTASEIKDNLLYAEPALRLSDKLLAQTTNDSTRRKILLQKIDAYYLLAVYYSRSGDTSEQKENEYIEKGISIFEELKDTASIIGAYQSRAHYYLEKGNFTRALESIQKAISKSRKMNYPIGIAMSYAQLGDIYRDHGENTEALNNYQYALSWLEKTKDTTDLRNVLAAMGGFFYTTHDLNKSLDKYHRVISLYKAQKLDDKIGLVYEWIGDAYAFNNFYDSAFVNYAMSLKLLSGTDRKDKMREVNDAIGTVYFKQGNFDKAIEFHLEALKVAEEMKSQIDIASSCLHLANAYHEKGNNSRAKKYNDRALAILIKQNLIKSLAESELLAAKIDSANGNGMSAFAHYKQYTILNEKLKAEVIHKEAQREKFQNDFDKQQAEARSEQERKDIKQRNIRNSIGGGLIAALIFLLMVFRQRNRIFREKKRSDGLLLNILPPETAEELKATGTAKAKSYDQVTVMFTDFKNFTSMSEKLSAQELVNEINYCYSAFDNIISKHGIEKIKTIGDSYMCAGGLPVANKTNAIDTVTAAIEIRDFMETEKQKRIASNLPYFEIRIGCNTGSVVAGIVGIKKFAYDIWGDTVNIASRMESSGETGKINISGSTYELVKNKFTCAHRGKIEAKNKGMIDMYFVNDAKN